MEIKTRQQLYEESANKLRRYEKGEYYLSSALNMEANELWVRVEESYKNLSLLRHKVKCYLEDEKRLPNEIVNNVKEYFAEHMQELFVAFDKERFERYKNEEEDEE